jgi:hypothetical protein
VKDEHDLRGARFAFGQTDFADIVEIAGRAKWFRADGHRLCHLRFAASRHRERDY